MAQRADLPDNLQTDDNDDGSDDELKRRRERFQEMQTYWSPIHEAGVQDDKLIAGEHWDGEVKKDREEEGRPMLTYNVLPASVRQIVNKVRQDRPQLRIKPVESDRAQTPDVSNVQGTQDYSLADVYMGLWRNLEHVSQAEACYDHAIQHGAEHGFGYFTMKTRYCRHDPFVQEAYLQRVKNSYTVYMDPSAQDVVFQDMQDAFVFSQMTKPAFEHKYPGKQAGNFNTGAHGATYEGWFDKDGITVATYYWVEWLDDEVIKMNNGKVHYLSLVEDVLDDMKRDQGIYIQRSGGKEMKKAVKRPEVRWQKMTALEFLTDETPTVFEQIPIFPCLGDEVMVDGRTIYKSAIRDARDAQKSYNYHRTASTEVVGLQPKIPFIGYDAQFEGHEDDWENANRENAPYLSVNLVEDSAGNALPLPQRQPPPQTAGAELTNAQQDLQDIRYIIGITDADLGLNSQEKSGKAILARQAQGATGTFTFPDNLSRAIEAAGRTFVNAAPRLYDTARVLRVRLPDDTEDFVEINKMEEDKKTGKMHLVHDLAYGKYDVTIDTGPSYQSQREEQQDAMLELLGALPPELAQLVVHIMVEAMAFPGADKVASILRKALPDQFKSEADRAADLPKGVIFDDKGEMVYEDSGEPYTPPMTPELQVRQEEAAATKAEKEAEAKKHEGTIATAQAKMADAEAKMAELQAGGGDQEPDFSGLLPEIEAIVAKGFEDHAMDQNAHKDVIETVMSEAIVDILRRVKKYVDGETKKLAPPDTSPRSESGDSRGEAGAPAAGKGSASPSSVQVVVTSDKPDRVRIKTDGDGMVATPEYDNADESG